jgi:hypothetical protein
MHDSPPYINRASFSARVWQQNLFLLFTAATLGHHALEM